MMKKLVRFLTFCFDAPMLLLFGCWVSLFAAFYPSELSYKLVVIHQTYRFLQHYRIFTFLSLFFWAILATHPNG